jgi:hypothetical protein
MSQHRPRRWGVAAGYAIVVGVGVAAVFNVGDTALLAGVLIVGGGLTALLYADFSKFRIGGEGFGVEAERAEEAASQLQHAVTEVVTVTAAKERGELPAATELDRGIPLGDPPGAQGGDPRSEPSSWLEERHRRAIEKLVENAYELGWAESRLMMSSNEPPDLELEWSADGQPRLAITQHISSTLEDLGERA